MQDLKFTLQIPNSIDLGDGKYFSFNYQENNLNLISYDVFNDNSVILKFDNGLIIFHKQTAQGSTMKSNMELINENGNVKLK